MIDPTAFYPARQLAAEVRAAVLPPPPVLTVSEWADRERVLGSEETSEPGQWKTSRVPYLKGVMDACSDPTVRTVVFKGSARIGKTSVIENLLGFVIDQDPCPVLLVNPSEGKSKDFSKEKFTPMVRNTPVLRGKVAESKTRDSENTLLHKTFQGGYVAMVGSNTPSGLDARTCKIVIFDELDKCAKAAKAFGDPRALAKNRTLTYPGRYLHLLLSTPSEEGDSPIDEEYAKTDMCQIYVPCPHCGEMQTLKMDRIRWPDGHPESAYYVCGADGCGAIISDADKLEMLNHHEWRPERPDVVGARGFWCWAAYSPWVTFAQIATVFVERRHDGMESFKVFVNEWLGETWKPNQGQESRVEGLLARARESRYISGVVPNEVGILFGSGDVQGDRLEVLVRGVGIRKKKCTIKHVVISGNLATLAPWNRLEKIILSNWTREDGQQMRIKRFCLDAGGHYNKEVLAFCRRPRMRGFVVPVRGATRPQIKVAIKAKRTANLWMLDTVALKDTIYAELRIENSAMPGYQQFPSDLEANYFQQLTCEKKIKGKYAPVPEDARNEIIDLHAYIDGAEAIHGLRKGEIEELVQFYADGLAFRAGGEQEEPEPAEPVEPLGEVEAEDAEVVPVAPPPELPRGRKRGAGASIPRRPGGMMGGGILGW